MDAAASLQQFLEARVFQSLWDAPMSSRGYLTVRETEVRLRGLDHGRAVIRNVTQVANFGTILTLHEAGSSHWTGRGMKPGYSGATTFTVLIQAHDTATALPTDKVRLFRYVNLSRAVEVKSSEAERDVQHWHAFKVLKEMEMP